MAQSRVPIWSIAAALAICLAACGDATYDCPEHAACVDIPFARSIPVYDVQYSPSLERVIAPLRGVGVALIEAEDLSITVVGGFVDATSAAEGPGLILVADRVDRAIVAIDPASGERVASAPTSRRPDLVRYVEATGEAWVSTEAGTEVFRVDVEPPSLVAVEILPFRGGPVVRGSNVYFFTESTSLKVIDAAQHVVTAEWEVPCETLEGPYPRQRLAIDDEHGLALVGCERLGLSMAVDLMDGHIVGIIALGGGDPLVAFSSATGHFYTRETLGNDLSILSIGEELEELGRFEINYGATYLMADPLGGLWTVDEEAGQILRVDDPF